jgi:hypothetical protein
MKDNPRWINVTELMQKGVARAITRLLAVTEFAANINIYINRINNVFAIKDIQLHGEVDLPR